MAAATASDGSPGRRRQASAAPAHAWRPDAGVVGRVDGEHLGGPRIDQVLANEVGGGATARLVVAGREPDERGPRLVVVERRDGEVRERVAERERKHGVGRARGLW
jgi:hypothetical protein